MPRRILTFALTTALACFSLTSAAQAVVPAVQRAVPRALATAEAQWGDYPCKGHTSVVFVATDSISAGETPTAGGGTIGEADISNCVLNIDEDVDSPVDLCGELTHETRHLMGMWDPTDTEDPWHSPNPQSIMNAYYSGPTLRCMRAFRPPAVTRRQRAGWRCRADHDSRDWVCHRRGIYTGLSATTGHAEW